MIVVDHGSQDGSRAIAAAEPAVTVLDFAGPGLADVYNTAIAASTAPLVALMGQDDLYEPGALDVLARALGRAPEAGMACGSVHYFVEPGTAPPSGMRPGLTGAPRRARLFETTLWRGAALHRLGPLRRRMSSDVDLYLRAHDASVTIAWVDDVVCHKRLLPGSTGHTPGRNGLLVAAVRESLKRKGAHG